MREALTEKGTTSCPIYFLPRDCVTWDHRKTGHLTISTWQGSSEEKRHFLLAKWSLLTSGERVGENIELWPFRHVL